MTPWEGHVFLSHTRPQRIFLPGRHDRRFYHRGQGRTDGARRDRAYRSREHERRVPTVFGSKKAGIKPFLGLEAYVVDTIDDKKAKRHHLSLLAYTTQGYKNLARLSSLSHERDHYHYKPRLDRLDFITASSTALLTGSPA